MIAQRTKRYIGKAVLPNVDADDEGVINFTATGIKVGSDEYETGEYCSRIAGVLAGTPIGLLCHQCASARGDSGGCGLQP